MLGRVSHLHVMHRSIVGSSNAAVLISYRIRHEYNQVRAAGINTFDGKFKEKETPCPGLAGAIPLNGGYLHFVEKRI